MQTPPPPPLPLNYRYDHSTIFRNLAWAG